jgi:hypothetical protein
MATPGISGFSHPCQPIDPCTDSTGSAGFVGFWLRLGYITRVPPPPRSLSHGWAVIVRPWMVLPAWAARQPPPQSSISRHWGFFTGEARLQNAGALWAGAIARWSNSAAADPPSAMAEHKRFINPGRKHSSKFTLVYAKS